MDDAPHGVLFQFRNLPTIWTPKIQLFALVGHADWGWAAWADPRCEDPMDAFAAACSQKGGTAVVLDLREMWRHATVYTGGAESYYLGSGRELWLVGDPKDPNRPALDKYGLEAALDQDPEQEYELLVSAIDLALEKIDINLSTEGLRAAIAAATR